MLKHLAASADTALCTQPPSGGCVLKLDIVKDGKVGAVPAAFRRLCVETFTR